ncbi:hypothetical protein KE639_04492 [Streptomyces sp. V17-9]|nr:hypothetical protein KE639_04492 [Streptomyces sp. V17-9]
MPGAGEGGGVEAVGPTADPDAADPGAVAAGADPSVGVGVLVKWFPSVPFLSRRPGRVSSALLPDPVRPARPSAV